MAWIVSEVETAMAPLYKVDPVVGVEPLVV
jgi:hypothetical protein